MKTKILLFAGQIGSGKGYISAKKTQELKEVGNTILQFSFANPIKKLIDSLCFCDKNLVPIPYNDCIKTCSLTGFNLVMVEHVDKILDVANLERFIEFTEEQLQIVDKLYELSCIVKNDTNQDIRKSSIRLMYQLFGTELMQTFNKCVWAIFASNRIKQINKAERIDYIIIEDFRFLMEFFSMVILLTEYKIIPYAIIASDEVRAKRRNITVEKLKEISNHLSEQEFDICLLPWMKLRYSENIIENN